jgi:branched-subunit amino acid transport protein
MIALASMVMLAAVCWLFRVAFVTLVPAERLPAGLRAGLENLAPAVLAAIVAVEVVSMIGDATSGEALPLLAAVAVTGVVARLTRSLSIVCGVGLGLVLLLDLVL